MKKRLWLSLAAVVAVASVGLGTTLAMFSDKTVNEGNTFTSGQLCLKADRDNSEPVPGPMFYVSVDQGIVPGYPDVPGRYHPTGVWAPGNTATKMLNVWEPSNCLDAWLVKASAKVVASKTFPAYLGNPGYTLVSDPAMTQYMTVDILAPDEDHNYVVMASKPLDDFLSGKVDLLYPSGTAGVAPNRRVLLTHGASPVDLQFRVHFNLDAPNAVQGKSLIVTFYLYAVQADDNPNAEQPDPWPDIPDHVHP